MDAINRRVSRRARPDAKVSARLAIAVAAGVSAAAWTFAAQAQVPSYAADKAELIRRVEAGESENGFCAKVSFPARTNIEDFFGYLDGAKPGAEFFARSDYGTSGGCSYYRILSAFQDKGLACLQTKSWACFDKGDQSGQCHSVERHWCREGNMWRWRAK